jgi:methylated-DNA-protein-cysteine methyltransferase-like protein
MTMPPGGLPNPPENPTSFQSAVIAVVASLQSGDIATYAEVAAEAGHPGSAQAVANVLRRVPDLPWWRVIPSSGRLYRTHRPTQEPLLRAEGITIDDTGRIASEPRASA